MKKPTGHFSISVTDKCTRVGNAKEHGVSRLDLVIQDSVATNYL
jgi:hypothetical protein